MQLDRAEQELLDSVERGDWRSIAHREKEAKRYQGNAKSAFRKDGSDASDMSDLSDPSDSDGAEAC